MNQTGIKISRLAVFTYMLFYAAANILSITLPFIQIVDGGDAEGSLYNAFVYWGLVAPTISGLMFWLISKYIFKPKYQIIGILFFMILGTGSFIWSGFFIEYAT